MMMQERNAGKMKNNCDLSPRPTYKVNFSVLEQKKYEKPSTVLKRTVLHSQGEAIFNGVYNESGTAILSQNGTLDI